MLMSRVRIQTLYLHLDTAVLHLPAGPGHMQQMVTVEYCHCHQAAARSYSEKGFLTTGGWL